MARLTFKDGFGKWAFLIVGRQFNGKVAEKLAQYENLGDPSELQRIKRGTWKPSLKYPGFYECSACADCFIDPDYLEKGKWHFCPHCGADLRSDEERTAANE